MFRTKIIILGVILLVLPKLSMATAGISGYPELVNFHYRWDIVNSEVEELVKYDILIIDPENQFYSLENLQEIKKINPEIKILAYFSISDIMPHESSLDEGTIKKEMLGTIVPSGWILKDASGNNKQWWDDYYILNVTAEAPLYNGERWQNYLPKIIKQKLGKYPKIWDGVMFDNLWEGVSWLGETDLNNDGVADDTAWAESAWQAGIKKILKQTRKKMGKDFIITGNGGVLYLEKTDGVLLEHFPDRTIYGDWTDALTQYALISQDAPYPLINSNNQNSDEIDYQNFRYGLASALLYDGYFNYDRGDASHDENWWFDEYSTALGAAVSSAYNTLNTDHPNKIQEGVWRRDFANGLVLVNSTDTKRTVNLETGYEKINGTQDPEVNDGSLIGSVVIPSHDGIIILGRLAQIINATYVNGGYAKVFNMDGDLERNSFFSYDAAFSGGTEIVEVTEKNKTIVADDTYVTVYKNGTEIAKFAPYGTAFTGGVNIAVNKLYKNDARYYIVTGTRNYGPQVRIYNLKGELVNAGTFPYAESFQGGVNVGIGDVNGDKKMEIIVAAGYGGGPHVRILNNQCELIDPGFFAYDKNARYGVNIGVGDLDADGIAEIVTGPGPGGPPEVRIFDKSGTLIGGGFNAYAEDDTSGILVGVTDIDANGTNEIVTSSFGIFNL